jgi:hypothetical protein
MNFSEITNNENFKISLNCYHDLCIFAHWIQESLKWASTQTHYHKLDEWCNPYWNEIGKNLNKYGFVNGIGCNCTNYDCRLWWLIYGYDSVHDPNLITNVERHHASASECAKAALMRIEQLCEYFQKHQFD